MMQLAIRNLTRHRKRTAIALAAISFGVIALLLAGGFIEWIYWGMREGAIQSRLGHIQVTQPGYFESGSADPFAFLLPDQLREKVAFDAIPEVDVVSERLEFVGLVSHDDITIGFTGEGVAPEIDAKLSQHLIITSGRKLSSADPNGILVGGGLAANLDVTIGDTVVLLATTSSGGFNGVECTVRGIFQSASKSFDDTALRLPLETAKQLVHVAGTHRWVMLLNKTENTDAVLQQLQKQYPQATSGLQFTPWYALADFYNKTVALFSKQMYVMRLIIALIIILSISNTMMMGVLERTGEIGTLMAIGIKRRSIMQLFVTEGLLLGLAGGMLGIILGGGLAEIISTIGIPMPPPPGMDVGFTGRIMVTLPLSVSALSLAVLTSLFGGFFPAWKASRLDVVDALRHNR